MFLEENNMPTDIAITVTLTLVMGFCPSSFGQCTMTAGCNNNDNNQGTAASSVNSDLLQHVSEQNRQILAEVSEVKNKQSKSHIALNNICDE